MRRQYHSRRVGNHRLIWDVHRLIELTRSLPVQPLALAEIAELDEPFWFEAEAKAVCREIALHAKLILETDLAYPIILSSDGRVMDGMHRVCKAWLEGRLTVAAVQFRQDPEPDYVDVELDDLPYDEPW